MFLTKLNPTAQKSVSVSTFLGYDGRARAPMGAFSQMRNLTAEGYPTLNVRAKRSEVAALESPGGMIAKDCLIWVEGTRVYFNGAATALTVTQGEKQLLSMGAYLLIWPDKKYLNTQNLSDCGSIENITQTTGTVRFILCRGDGTEYEGVSVAESAPESPADKALWLDRGAVALKQWDGEKWQEVADVATRVDAAGIGLGFLAGDSVEISGCTAAQIDGLYPIDGCDADYLLLPLCAVPGQQTEQVTVRRYVPEMDFVVECGNRIWGCKYGIVDGEPVNAVYGSALGDFRNWNSFRGLASDSYAASRGSDGVFTGACGYLGSVLFFKENCIERLYIASGGGHQMTTLECAGVQQGSHKSCAVVEGTLFYHGRGGVYAFDGSMPQCVSQAWGELTLHNAAAGSFGGKYYLSAADRDGGQHFFVLDTAKGLWHRQDELAVRAFAVASGELFAMTDSAIISLHGRTGTVETEDVAWYAVTPELTVEDTQRRYVVRLEVRLQPEAGSAVHAALSYDGGETWHDGGTVEGGGTLRAVRLTVRPVRADRVRLKLYGTGGCRIYSLRAVYSEEE